MRISGEKHEISESLVETAKYISSIVGRVGVAVGANAMLGSLVAGVVGGQAHSSLPSAALAAPFIAGAVALSASLVQDAMVSREAHKLSNKINDIAAKNPEIMRRKIEGICVVETCDGEPVRNFVLKSNSTRYDAASVSDATMDDFARTSTNQLGDVDSQALSIAKSVAAEYESPALHGKNVIANITKFVHSTLSKDVSENRVSSTLRAPGK